MTFSQLKKIVEETGLSPEQLATAFGVSNMTLRRWSKEPPAKQLPIASSRSLVEGIYQLIIEGHLRQESPVVKEVLEQSPSQSFKAVLSQLGVVTQEVNSEKTYEDKAAVALFQIGADSEHRATVDKSEKRLDWFKKMGKNWSTHILSLTSVIRNKGLTHMDKMVAYGALFYLISPIDLIPDALPFAGVTDDYSFLIMAVGYYSTRLAVSPKSEN